MYNTIALAYLNKDNEIVAWSADTFGSPRDYPKTYKDSEDQREMLLKKFSTREKFANEVADGISSVSNLAGAIMKESLSSDKDIFEEKGIVKSQVMLLELTTNYDTNSPSWKNVQLCIDNKKYSAV